MITDTRHAPIHRPRGHLDLLPPSSWHRAQLEQLACEDRIKKIRMARLHHRRPATDPSAVHDGDEGRGGCHTAGKTTTVNAAGATRRSCE